MKSNLIDAIKLPFRKEKELYRSFYSIMGFYPRDIRPYKEAIQHISASTNDGSAYLHNNERLEFLGDAILGAVVGSIVFQRYTRSREGFLTNTRSKVVKRETLGQVAQQLGLHKLILSHTHGNGHNSYLAGNAFEALVGAIYLDRGYDYCTRFIETRVLGKLINLDKIAYKETNFKSMLLEFCQKNHLVLNFVLVEEERDKKGAPFFRSKVMVDGNEMGQGKGYSKKESQQNASKNALHNLKNGKGPYSHLVKTKGRSNKRTEKNEPDTHHTTTPETQGA
ncbi:MAG: ribonuclease III [Bacteroidaceae bacterium]|nr:ribonuclease III [Bacteroidaceae bacterium]